MTDLSGFNHEKVLLSYSTNGGNTWSSPAVVSTAGDRGFYAFATARPRSGAVAEPGPQRTRRQHRLDALARATLVDEDTVLPAVPLWFDATRDDRAQLEIDHLGSGSIATDCLSLKRVPAF